MRTRTFRATLHGGILLGGALLLILADLNFDFLHNTLGVDPDKHDHFVFGRIIASVCFYMAYACIILRIINPDRGTSLSRVLLWLPALLFGGLTIAVSIVFLVAAGKEAADLFLGIGVMDWEDVLATLDGAKTIVPLVEVLVVATPFLVPLDLLIQIPSLMNQDIRGGLRAVDRYVNASKEQEKNKSALRVLIVEDDIDFAASMMDFLSGYGLKCRHVSSVKEADECLKENLLTIRLLIVDNFVRISEVPGESRNNLTGADWLDMLSRSYPAGKRRFQTIMASGHPEFAGDLKGKVDFILPKPWKAAQLLEILSHADLIQRAS